MSNIKVLTSACERVFLSKIFTNGSNCRRLDGREPYDGRNLEIAFSKEYGCCIVMLGNTRAIAQVSCDISEPKGSRPAEGSLLVNLELSPMAAPHFENGRMCEESIESSRLLERCIRDSHCIDLEALCIVAGEKVFHIKVDVQVLNHDGNIIECSSIAAISALAHFRRPDVTVVGTDITVHSPDDHNPVALNLHHMPVNVTMGIYEKGEYVLIDPVEIEERVAEGRVVIGVNAHQEICSLHLSGVLVLTKNKILQCTDLAVKRAQVITQAIRKAIDEDLYKRATNQPVGFVSMLHTDTILGAKHHVQRIDVSVVRENSPDQNTNQNFIEEINIDETESTEGKYLNTDHEPSTTVHRVRTFLEACGESAVFEGGATKWGVKDTDELSSDSEEGTDEESVKVEKVISDESESDEDVVLQSEQVDSKAETSQGARGWYTKNAFM